MIMQYVHELTGDRYQSLIRQSKVTNCTLLHILLKEDIILDEGACGEYLIVIIQCLCYVVGLWGIPRCGSDTGQKVTEDCEL